LNESRGLSSRRALTACALAAPPEYQPPRSKRRLSRDALVTSRWQSDRDKTRVSSINKRRVISVPEEGAASAEVETSGLDRSGAPLEVWDTEAAAGCATSLLALLAENPELPVARWGMCPLTDVEAIGLPSAHSRAEGPIVRRQSRLPAEPIHTARLPADQSRLRVFCRIDLPAHRR